MRLLLVLSLLLSGCFEEQARDADDAPPGDDDPAFVGECGSNRGLDLLWDTAHSDFSDFDEHPAPQAGWPVYQDPEWPLLGFYHPPDWTPTSLSEPGQIGVYLRADDGSASFMLLYLLQPRTDLTAEQIVDSEMDFLAGDAALGPSLCTDQGDTVGAVGTDAMIEARAAGDFLFMLQSTVIYDPDGRYGYPPGGAMNAAIYRFVGRDDVFTEATERVFLPILFQLLIGDADNTDSDGDGIYDRYDAFPFDPTRS